MHPMAERLRLSPDGGDTVDAATAGEAAGTRVTRAIFGRSRGPGHEVAICRAICAGTVTLTHAQHEIASDWIAAGVKYGVIPAPPTASEASATP